VPNCNRGESASQCAVRHYGPAAIANFWGFEDPKGHVVGLVYVRPRDPGHPVTIDQSILFEPKGMPRHWVVYDGTQPVMFPARPDGWSERSLYAGHLAALRYAKPRLALGTGWPGAK